MNEPTQWREMVVVTLVREGINKHKARELADHFAAQPEQEPWLLESTKTLAKTLAREFYPEVTQWECLDDLAGVISQIDNMATGLMRKTEQVDCPRCGHVCSQREWVGLTDDEVYKIAFALEGEHWRKIADAIEAKLKEKNR